MAEEKEAISCAYNYILTAHKPTSVTQSAVGSFTGSSDVNLIVAKSSRLEIHRLTEEGLQGLIDVPLYGRISVLELFRPDSFEKDILFILTERYKFCVLEYTKNGELQTLANGDLSDKIGRPSESGHIGIIDKKCSMIGLHLYDGFFKVIPMDRAAKFDQAFNIRLDELKVIDIKFLDSVDVPTIAVLSEDTKEQRHVRTYKVLIDSKEIEQGPWMENNVDRGSSLLIPTSMNGGCIIVGENKIQYKSSDGSATITIAPTLMKTYAQVGADGSRFLLSDYLGNLFLLVLENNDNMMNLKMEKLGETSIPSSLCYLDSGIVFVGSSMGDSSLIKLHADKVEGTNSFVEQIDTMPNLGPIVDFSVIDLDRQGQGQIVACSGGGMNGSLRVIRNGIGFNQQASIELSGVKGVWNIPRDVGDSYMILSFIGETRVLGMNMEEELDEIELNGVDIVSTTIYCSNLDTKAFTQVTPSQIRMISQDGSSLLAAWAAPENDSILAASSNSNMIAVALSSRQVHLFQCSDKGISESFSVQLEEEISCIDCSEGLLAVGLWNMTVMTYSIPSFEEVERISLAEDVMARSILVSDFDGSKYLLCGLGDGSLLSYNIDSKNATQDRRKLILGTKPVNLRSFRYRGDAHVFAASDRPTVIHSTNGKLMFSNLNEGEVNHISSFGAKSYPDTLVLVKPDSLEVGSMDSIQKLHVRTVPLHEQPRRIAHMATSKAILVTTSTSFLGYENDEGDRLRLLDDQTFETLDTFQLLREEMACCAAAVQLQDEDKEFFAVGSAFAPKSEPEPTSGRIRLFAVVENRLSLVSQVDTKGAVYSIATMRQSLLAGINSRIQMYRWEKPASALIPTCGHFGHTIVLQIDVCGDLILVGDLMKSLQVHVYRPDTDKIELYARDYHPVWMSSVLAMSKSFFLGADSGYNIFTARKNEEGANDEDRCRLDIVGQFHVGDYINRFRRGSLVMKLPDSEISKVPTVLYGTINGAIGIIASLPAEQYEVLSELQEVLRGHIMGVGGLSHEDWRSFQSAFVRGDTSSKGFIDGDLLEQILDLDRVEQMRILKCLGGEEKVSRALRLVEDLSRLH